MRTFKSMAVAVPADGNVFWSRKTGRMSFRLLTELFVAWIRRQDVKLQACVQSGKSEPKVVSITMRALPYVSDTVVITKEDRNHIRRVR